MANTTIKITKRSLEEMAEKILDSIEELDDGDDITINSPDGHAFTLEIVCEYCLGTGEVSCDEQDADGHWQRGVGIMVCRCRAREPIDMSGATEGDR